MHIAVLKNEVMQALDPQPNQNFIDATFGLGGHTKTILEKTKPNGKVLGIEADGELCKKQVLDPRIILVNDSYVNLKNIIEKYQFKPAHGILLDLGMSSWHLEHSNRGFSFQKDEPLNMGYNPEKNTLTASQIINQWPPQEIEHILKEYGEERFAKSITQEIIKQRKQKPIITSLELAEIIKNITPGKKQKIHPATKTFQALRIAVNNELENIKQVLPQALEILKPAGRLAVISFHSLEDRIIKRYFKQLKEQGLAEILTKKPITASEPELKQNSRARSAKLRVIKKI